MQRQRSGAGQPENGGEREMRQIRWPSALRASGTRQMHFARSKSILQRGEALYWECYVLLYHRMVSMSDLWCYAVAVYMRCPSPLPTE